jgi:hypothetical protein
MAGSINRRVKTVIILLAILGIAGLAIREHFDPWLILTINDWLHPKPVPLVAPLDEGLALRLYADTRPHNGKIDELQKGLVLLVNGQEKIEEGFGFGAPIVGYGERTYLSRHAEIAQGREHGREVLTKRFTIDVADHPSQFLRVKYRDAPPLGTVLFTYTIMAPGTISVTVNLSDLNVPWYAVYIMNEQGARAFPLYRGHTGSGPHPTPQSGDAVGIWHPVEDTCGCWISKDQTLGFCVETGPEYVKYAGRERYWQYHWAGIYTLSWSGVDVELTPPVTQYRYTLHVTQFTPDQGTDTVERDVTCP